MCETRSSSTGSRPKKCSRTYAPSRDLNVWYSPSTHSSITLTSRPSVSAASSGSQRVPQIDLDHVPAGAAEVGLELLDDLAVAANRAVEPLQVAVDDPDQVVELLAAGERRSRPSSRARPSRRRRGTPTPCARRSRRSPRACEVLHEPRLVDRGDRADPERHRRELPELRHQPRVRIGATARRPSTS